MKTNIRFRKIEAFEKYIQQTMGKDDGDDVVFHGEFFQTRLKSKKK